MRKLIDRVTGLYLRAPEGVHVFAAALAVLLLVALLVSSC